MHKKTYLNFAESPMVSQKVECLDAALLYMPFTRLFFFSPTSLAKRWLQISIMQFPLQAASKPLERGS